MKTYDDFVKIRGWAHQRNLVSGSTTDKQFTKLIEEIGELAAGLARQDQVKVMDGIGDTVVVLTILGWSPRQSLPPPWESVTNGSRRCHFD